MPRVLLTHDGELGDVRGLLEEMGVDFQESCGGLQEEEQQILWKVVIGTPERVLALQVGASGEKPTRMAVLEEGSRGRVPMLRRSGIDLMIHCPVHPTALRLLILHALYQGPEKRRHPRMTIGASVRYRVGVRKRTALLADLSLRGCRLITNEPVPRDRRIKIFLGRNLGGSGGLALGARVVRSGPTEGIGDGGYATAVVFDLLPRAEARRLREILAAHRTAPASLAHADVVRAHTLDMVASQVAPSRDDVSDVVERRQGPRYAIDRHVIALGVEAACVLIGRDISLKGMRVDSHDSIDVGDELQVALHVGTSSEPLVVQARVERDDGDQGMMLSFHGLSETAESYLDKQVGFLPILAARGGDQGSGVIVSQVLEWAHACSTAVTAE